MKTEAFSSEEWETAQATARILGGKAFDKYRDCCIHPDDLEVWELAEYTRLFNAYFDSYKAHYCAAMRLWPARVSLSRMLATADAVAVARLMDTEKDRRRANTLNNQGFWRYA